MVDGRWGLVPGVCGCAPEKYRFRELDRTRYGTTYQANTTVWQDHVVYVSLSLSQCIVSIDSADLLTDEETSVVAGKNKAYTAFKFVQMRVSACACTSTHVDVGSTALVGSP